MKCQIFLCDFNTIWNSMTDSNEDVHFQISRKPVHFEPHWYMLDTGRQTEGHEVKRLSSCVYANGHKIGNCWCIGCVPRGSDVQFGEHVWFLPSSLAVLLAFGRSITQGTDFLEREHDNVMLGEPSFHPHQGFLATWPYFFRFLDPDCVVYTSVTSATCPIPWVSNPLPANTFVN